MTSTVHWRGNGPVGSRRDNYDWSVAIRSRTEKTHIFDPIPRVDGIDLLRILCLRSAAIYC